MSDEPWKLFTYTDMASDTLDDTVPGNGLLPDGTKPLFEPSLTYQWSIVSFTWQQFYSERSRYLLNQFENYTFRITATSPRAQWVKTVLNCITWVLTLKLSFQVQSSAKGSIKDVCLTFYAMKNKTS